MIFPSIKSFLCFSALAVFLLSIGCTAKARAERHTKRGDEYYAKSEWDKAKLEYLNAVRKGSRDPEVLGRLGQCFFKVGELGPAYQFLSSARTAQPTNIVARQIVGSLLMAFGEAKKAHEEAEAILKLVPADPQAIVLLAQSSTTAEQIASAKKLIEQLQAAAPTQPAYPYTLGLLALNSSNRVDARAAFEKAISIDPKQSRFHLALANVAMTSGDVNTADASFKSAISVAPVKSWERLQYAEFLENVGRQDDAEKFLIQTVAQAPDFSRAIDNLTELLLARGKLDEGEKYNQQALALGPTDVDASLNHARLKHLRGDDSGAATDLQELARTHPKNANIQYHLGLACLATHDSVKAEAALANAVTLDPKHKKAVILRSDLQLQKGDFNAAIPELTRILRDSPGMVQANLLLASAYRLRGTPTDALPIYAALGRAMPKDVRPAFFTGLTYREMNKPADAREAFNRALIVQPDHVGSVEELTQLDVNDKKFNDAISRLKAFEEKYPKAPLLYLLQARVLMAEKKTDDAIQISRKALEISPDYEPAQRTLVELYIAKGQPAEAVERLNVILKKNPKDAVSLLQLGILQEQSNDLKAAQASYEGAVKLDPNSPTALNNLAALLERLNNPDAALEYAKKAHDLAPNQPYISDTYGWALFQKADYPHALDALQPAGEKLPNFPEVQYHLGMALYMIGAEAPAALALNSALQGPTDFSGKENGRRALTILKMDPAHASPADVQSLQDVLKAQPNDFVARLRLAQIDEQQKQWERASQGYQAALKINPRATNTLAHLAELTCFNLGNPQRALELAKQAWVLSQDADVAAIVGPVGYVVGDFKWASPVLSTAARAHPENSHIAFYRASADYGTGNLKAAQRDFQDIQGAGSEAALAQAAVTLLDYQLNPGDSAPALAASAAALQLDPNFAPALLVNGLLAESKKDFTAARTGYEKLLKAAPSNIPAERQLGLLLAENSAEDQRATQLLTAAKAEMPGDPQISKALGKLAYRRADYSEAAKLLRDAALRLNNDSDLLYHLGMAQYHLNDRQARDALSRALKIDSNATMAAAARKAMDELK